MNFRNNKGFTGVDISVSLIVIVLFVSIIATLLYNFGITSKAVNRKATATDIAILKIEEIKQSNNYDTLEQDFAGIENLDLDENGQIIQGGPYTVTISVEKYIDSDYAQNLTTEEKNNMKDVIKIVTVMVEYTVGNNKEGFDISTVITKES